MFAFGLHGILMAMPSMDSGCPMGFVCPLTVGHNGPEVPLASTFVLMALIAAFVGALLTIATSQLEYHPPLSVFANAGPPVILKTIKRE